MCTLVLPLIYKNKTIYIDQIFAGIIFTWFCNPLLCHLSPKALLHTCNITSCYPWNKVLIYVTGIKVNCSFYKAYYSQCIPSKSASLKASIKYNSLALGRQDPTTSTKTLVAKLSCQNSPTIDRHSSSYPRMCFLLLPLTC